MPDWRDRRIRLPLASWPLALLVAAFLLPGLAGHDPWKSVDAIGFGVVFDMLDRGGWLQPGLAGEPFYEDGPLYFWVAAAFARALSVFMPLHDGARAASALFVLGALYFVRGAARELYGKTEGDLSTLALMASVGLLWHGHETAPETAMLAGLAAAYYGLGIAHRKPLKAGLVFGLGAGVAFLAKGLLALAQPLVAALLVLPLSADLRNRRFAVAVGIGLVALAPFVIVWPALLAVHAPAYLEGWIAWQVASVTNPPRLDAALDYLKILAWAAWPVWPMSAWAAWEYRRHLRDPSFAVPFVAAIVTLVMLLFTGSADEMSALALLVPLAIPAGSAAVALRRGAANALSWFSLMTFSLIAGYMWLMWFATLVGTPDRLARRAERLVPGFVLEVNAVAVAVAVILTLAWAALLLRAERSTLRGLTLWAAGMTLIWGLAMTLWIDWIDATKSYRPVAESLRKQLPRGVACVESRGLGASQRAVFHYHAGLVTQRQEVSGASRCPFLLVQTSTREGAVRDPGTPWRRVWEGSRPRDHERYRLYRRG